MFEHIKLLLFLILLFPGIWVIFNLNQVQKSFPDKVIKAILIYSIWFFSIESIQFFIIYIRNNIDTSEVGCLFNCLNFILDFGALFSLYLMLNILLSFRGKSFKRSTNKWLLIAAVFIIISFIIKTAIPESQKLLGWVEYINLNIYSIIRITSYIELLVLIGFHFYWRNSNLDIERIKISKSFTFLFIIVNGIPIILFHIAGYYFALQNYEWIIIIFINFMFFLIIYVWTKFVYLDYAKKTTKLINKKENFKPIYAKYKISKREIEVIELIIDGKKSNEIKDELFISYHTVKNHISHIYEKLNVNSRNELIHFFKETQ